MTTEEQQLVERLREFAAHLGPASAFYMEEIGHLFEAVDTITRLVEERDEARDLVARLTLEAQIHAGEARAANSTIYEIYQVLSGSTGEPGNWNGAKPAREYVAASEAKVAELQEALKPFAREAEARANLALGPDIDHWPIGGSALTLGDLRRARRALEASK